jgi:hypothetical protein
VRRRLPSSSLSPFFSRHQEKKGNIHAGFRESVVVSGEEGEFVIIGEILYEPDFC